MDGNPLFMLDGAASGSEGGGDSVLNALLARGAEAESGSAGRLGGAETLARRSEGNGQTVVAARGADATRLLAALDLDPAQLAGTTQGVASITSCSATDWPAALDGGPGGSDAVGAFARDMDRLAGSESGSDTEPSDWVCTLCTW